MDNLLPLISFAFITSVTPGPNNLLLTVSGLRFGFRASVRHILGINAGMALLLLIAGSGVGSLLLALPGLETVLKMVGSGYLLWLAWGLRRISFADSSLQNDKPWGFVQALLFQFANPKALVMALTASSALMPQTGSLLLSVLLFCLLFCLVNLPCISFWALSGEKIRCWLQAPHWQRLFSTVIVLLTLWSALAIWV